MSKARSIVDRYQYGCILVLQYVESFFSNKISSHRSSTTMDLTEQVIKFIFEIFSSCIVIDPLPCKHKRAFIDIMPALQAPTQEDIGLQSHRLDHHVPSDHDEWEVL